MLPLGDIQIRSKYAADFAPGISQRYLACKKCYGISFGCRLGFFDVKLGNSALDHQAVIVAIQFCLMMPSHRVIVFPDDLLRIIKSRIVCKHHIAAEVDEICILPEYSHGNRIENPFDDLF